MSKGSVFWTKSVKLALHPFLRMGQKGGEMIALSWLSMFPSTFTWSGVMGQKIFEIEKSIFGTFLGNLLGKVKFKVGHTHFDFRET
jgi:hypothetical protein